MEKIVLMGQKIQKIDNFTIKHCVIPEGKFWENDWFGQKKQIGYSKSEIEQMFENYSQNILHYELILNVSHSDEKIGAIKELFVEKSDESQKGLWAIIELYEAGKELIENQKYAYLSPEIYENYITADGKEKKFVFAGVALTNHPRHKKMQKINFSEFKDFFEEYVRKFFGIENLELDMEGEKMEKELLELKQKYSEVMSKTEEYSKKIVELEEKAKILINEKTVLALEAWKSEKFAEGYSPANIEYFVKLISDGKISIELAGEMISKTDKVSEKQTYTADFNKTTITAEDLGKIDNEKFSIK